MISSPKIGDRCRVHYHKTAVPFMPHHGKHGTIIICSRRILFRFEAWKWTSGVGLVRREIIKRSVRNCGVQLDDGQFIVVPCGNLYYLKPEEES